MKYKNLLDIVVLAAGKGSRMKSKSLPKPLHSLNGIPMINYLLNNLPLSNFANKYIVVPDKHDEIKDAVLKSDNTFKYVKQSEPRGTGDALLQALDSLESETNAHASNGLVSACTVNGVGNVRSNGDAVRNSYAAASADPVVGSIVAFIEVT